MSIILKDRLMKDGNYMVTEFMHQALGELLRVTLLETSDSFRIKNEEILSFATQIYSDYLDIVGDASAQFKSKLN